MPKSNYYLCCRQRTSLLKSLLNLLFLETDHHNRKYYFKMYLILTDAFEQGYQKRLTIIDASSVFFPLFVLVTFIKLKPWLDHRSKCTAFTIQTWLKVDGYCTKSESKHLHTCTLIQEVSFLQFIVVASRFKFVREERMKKTSGTRVLMGHLLFYAVYFVALSFLDGPMPVVIMYAFSLTLIPTLHFLIKDMPDVFMRSESCMSKQVDLILYCEKQGV